MIIRISSFALSGIDIIDVDVQTSISPGKQEFRIVGLADKTIAESRERIKAALSSMGLALPAKNILVNLAPADLIKEGSHFDLPIAISLLTAMEIIPYEEICNYIIGGELSLDGRLLSMNGALPAAIGANARDKGFICPYDNGGEAAFSGNKGLLAPKTILELVDHFRGDKILTMPLAKAPSISDKYPDMSDIKGQDDAKRAIEIAASGEHNLLMFGPPGTGKSMLASRLPGILPKMSSSEMLECMIISSIANSKAEIRAHRPFRAPHHSSSRAALVGGGTSKHLQPGEISLAHNGILFLDELPEFPSNVIESLRQPVETGKILISRAYSHITYPARFQLIAAMNPCRCGYLKDSKRSCKDNSKCASIYQNKISGPILDRFDLTIEVPEIAFYKMDTSISSGETSEKVRQRVEKVRNIQKARYEGYGISTNARLEGKLLTNFAIPVDGSIDLLNNAADRFKLSMRSYNKILKIARTIADMAGDKNVTRMHLAEALNFKNLGFRESG